MKERWIVSWDGGATWTHEMNPVNGAKITFADSRDLDNGQVFFRRKLNTELLFTKDNYQQFLLQERNRNRRCKEIQIRCELFCHLNWQEVWRGKFSTGMGRFRLEHCEFYVKPEPLDKYSCTLERQGLRHNLLNAEARDVRVLALPPGIEVLVTQWPGPPFPGPSIYGWEQVDTQSITVPSGMGICSGTTSSYSIYWRETAITDCVNGSPVTPNGTGWIQLGDTEPNTPDPITCDDEGQTKWARQPSIAWPWPNDPIHVGPAVTSGNPVTPPESPACDMWYRVGGLTCVGGFAAGLYLCLGEASYSETIPRGRRVGDVLDYVLGKMDCGLQGVRSDFFGINAPGDAPGYTPGINYVTGLSTQTEGVLMVQKSDAIDPNASNPATIGEMTFKELMNALFVMFRVYWDIDRDGYLRIEHWKYWSTPVGLDLTTAEHVLEPLDYTHLTNEIPRIERATWAEALSRDFVGNDIVYSGPCVRPEENEEKEWSPGKITTDISYILTDPTAISKDGFAMLATTYDGVNHNLIVDFGAISGAPASNAPLSWANLQRDFWTWDRYLPSGNMNGQDVDFDGFLPNVEQSGVGYAACCKYLRLNPRKRVKTKLGSHLGDITAHIESAEFHMKDKRVRMVLRYAY